MVGLGLYFIALTGLGLLLLWRRRLYDSALFLKIAFLSIPLPVVANELGWIAAEVGRQPWVVYGLMRTDDAFSTVVPADQILVSLGLFTVVYALLFCVWIFLLGRKLQQGPGPETPRDVLGQEVLA